MGSDDDATLLKRAATEPEAFALFYRRHHARVLVYFARRTASPELAADLMAETFASALASVGSYRRRRTPALAWLFTIAHNQLVDAHRRSQVQDRARRRLGMEPLILGDADLDELEERLSAASEIEALLAGLTEREREIVVAHVVDERSHREIATELECSEAVVRQRLSRGLSRLRSNLEGSP